MFFTAYFHSYLFHQIYHIVFLFCFVLFWLFFLQHVQVSQIIQKLYFLEVLFLEPVVLLHAGLFLPSTPESFKIFTLLLIFWNFMMLCGYVCVYCARHLVNSVCIFLYLGSRKIYYLFDNFQVPWRWFLCVLFISVFLVSTKCLIYDGHLLFVK